MWQLVNENYGTHDGHVYGDEEWYAESDSSGWLWYNVNGIYNGVEQTEREDNTE